ncbi:hypothetical protein [Escherichia coli]|uniref:hypothetical protein n=1 Tax=Escherichia coli TaxID=562 RepID=UPI0038B3E9CB
MANNVISPNLFPGCVVSNREPLKNSLTAGITEKLKDDFANIDILNNAGVIGGHKITPKVSFRESFINILTHLLEILRLYRNEVNSTFIPCFHATPASQNSANKTWVAVTGLDSYVKIEKIAINKFIETQVSPGEGNKVRVFSGSSAQKFMQLLLEHDEEEASESNAELKAIANALKLEVAEMNLSGTPYFDKKTECRMIELLGDQKDLIPQNYLYQSDIQNLKLHEEEFKALLSDAERQIGGGNTSVLCCGEKMNDTVKKLLSEKIKDLTRQTKSFSYDAYEKVFKDVVFTPDECNHVRDSLNNDKIKPEKIEEIISCLSSCTGIGNFFYACSQAFHVANDNVAPPDVLCSIATVVEKLNNYLGFVSLSGRSYHLQVDFSEYEFTQTLSVLRAVVNEGNDTFDIANYIYTTKGENDIPNNAEDDSPYEYSNESYRPKYDAWSSENDIRNLRRNFSGNITIVAYT